MGQPIAGSNPALSASAPEHVRRDHRRGPMTSRLRTLGLSSGLLLVLTACGSAPLVSPPATSGSPTSSPSVGAAATQPPPVDGAPVSRSTEDQGIALTLQLSTDHVRAGAPVQLIVTATNTD